MRDDQRPISLPLTPPSGHPSPKGRRACQFNSPVTYTIFRIVSPFSLWDKLKARMGRPGDEGKVMRLALNDEFR
jgi:hypothetical protein